MLLLKITILINLLSWSIIVGQSYMYIIAMTNVQQEMDAPSYIRLRHLLDKNFMAKYKYVIYASLVSSLLLCVLTAASAGIVLFISSVVALLALIIDIILTLKGNMPINNTINSWTTEEYPRCWRVYRAKWLYIFKRRQVVSIAGFVSLLVGALFGN